MVGERGEGKPKVVARPPKPAGRKGRRPMGALRAAEMGTEARCGWTGPGPAVEKWRLEPTRLEVGQPASRGERVHAW
jgi:hypothetical protein